MVNGATTALLTTPLVESNPTIGLLVAPPILALAAGTFLFARSILRDGMRFLDGERYPRPYEIFAGWALIALSLFGTFMGLYGAYLSAGNLP